MAEAVKTYLSSKSKPKDCTPLVSPTSTPTSSGATTPIGRGYGYGLDFILDNLADEFVVETATKLRDWLKEQKIAVSQGGRGSTTRNHRAFSDYFTKKVITIYRGCESEKERGELIEHLREYFKLNYHPRRLDMEKILQLKKPEDVLAHLANLQSSQPQGDRDVRDDNENNFLKKYISHEKGDYDAETEEQPQQEKIRQTEPEVPQDQQRSWL